MSFGGSAGEIVAALQLLSKVIGALKDTDGASSDYQEATTFLRIVSVTLEHLKSLQAAPLDPGLACNPEQVCEHVQELLLLFRNQILSSFERDLGAGSTRIRFLSAGRKIKCAFPTSKKVKTLQTKIGGSIAVIGLVLSQRIVQNTLKMPAEIQARIAHTIDNAIDKRIPPLLGAVQTELLDHVKKQDVSLKAIKKGLENFVKSTEIKGQRHVIATQLEIKDLSISKSPSGSK